MKPFESGMLEMSQQLLEARHSQDEVSYPRRSEMKGRAERCELGHERCLIQTLTLGFVLSLDFYDSLSNINSSCIYYGCV